MTSLCFVNGEYMDAAAARISPFDRGFLFADAVYEVIPAYASRPFRFAHHLARLGRSLGELSIDSPHSESEWRAICSHLLAGGAASDQYLYLQVSRGGRAGERNPAPLPALAPTVFAYAAPWTRPADSVRRDGVRAITTADIRWQRCDIKTVALVGNVLLRQMASERDSAEALLLRDGWVTEGTSSSVHLVHGGRLLTPPDGPLLLPGTTRDVVLELANNLRVPCIRQPVSERQLRSAEEIWISSALREFIPVTRLDDAIVGDGRVGPLYRQLRAQFEAMLARESALPW
ncbi:MAG: aminotransferase class IV [Steroidobacteraceae bacterium]